MIKHTRSTHRFLSLIVTSSCFTRNIDCCASSSNNSVFINWNCCFFFYCIRWNTSRFWYRFFYDSSWFCSNNSFLRCFFYLKCIILFLINKIILKKIKMHFINIFTLASLIASTVVKNGRIFFSDTTFHAVPRASAELSRTVGSKI